MENLEHLGLMFRRDADAVVLDGADATAMFLFAGDFNHAGPDRTAVFNGIVNQVGKDLVDLGGVPQTGGERPKMQDGARLLELIFRGLPDGGQHLVQVQRSDAQRRAAQSGEAKKAAQQGVNLGDAGLDEGHGFGHILVEDGGEFALGASGGRPVFEQFINPVATAL